MTGVAFFLTEAFAFGAFFLTLTRTFTDGLAFLETATGFFLAAAGFFFAFTAVFLVDLAWVANFLPLTGAFFVLESFLAR